MRISILAALILACSCNSAPPSVKESPRYPNGLTAPEVFDLRTKCAEIVDKQSAALGMVGAALMSQVSPHYNPDTNRCYAEVVRTKNFSYKYGEHPVPDNYRTTAVYDAQTKQQLVFADQEGEKSRANDWTNKADSLVSYDQGLARINQLMQDDAL
jgi:hypothetical protein